MVLEMELVHHRVALNQRAGQVGLAAEVVEKGALGGARAPDDRVDRRGAEAVVEDQGLGRVEDALPGLFGVADAGNIRSRSHTYRKVCDICRIFNSLSVALVAFELATY